MIQFDSYVLQMACKHHLVLSRNGPNTEIFGPPPCQKNKKHIYNYIAQKPPIIYVDVLGGIVFGVVSSAQSHCWRQASAPDTGSTWRWAMLQTFVHWSNEKRAPGCLG